MRRSELRRLPNPYPEGDFIREVCLGNRGHTACMYVRAGRVIKADGVLEEIRGQDLMTALEFIADRGWSVKL